MSDHGFRRLVVIGRWLCRLGVHHIPDDRRRFYNDGTWVARCTRCRVQCKGGTV